MANITLDELRAKYPPEDRNDYDRAYAAATLAGQLAELAYTLRTRAGLTQTELARRMDTTQSSIARIESGGSLPTLDMLSRLAHATGSTPAPGRTRRQRHPACRGRLTKETALTEGTRPSPPPGPQPQANRRRQSSVRPWLKPPHLIWACPRFFSIRSRRI